MGGYVAKIIGYDEPPRQAQRQVQREAVKEEPKGPTRAEMDEKTRIGINRRGRRALILKSKTGVDENLTLGTKSLLGS